MSSTRRRHRRRTRRRGHGPAKPSRAELRPTARAFAVAAGDESSDVSAAEAALDRVAAMAQRRQ